MNMAKTFRRISGTMIGAKLEIFTPDSYVGDIVSNLQQRRGLRWLILVNRVMSIVPLHRLHQTLSQTKNKAITSCKRPSN